MRNIPTLGQRNTGEYNQGQTRQPDTVDAHQKGNMTKARREFKIKQETQDMKIYIQEKPTPAASIRYFS